MNFFFFITNPAGAHKIDLIDIQSNSNTSEVKNACMYKIPNICGEGTD